MDMSLQASHTCEWQRPVNRVLQTEKYTPGSRKDTIRSFGHGFDTLSS